MRPLRIPRAVCQNPARVISRANRQWAAIWIGVAALVALALPLAAQADPQPELTNQFCYGCQQLGLLVGGGFGAPIFGARDREVDHTRVFGVFPRWSIGVTDPLARGAFYQGNIDFGLEPLALFNYDPRDGWAAGACLLLRYNFLGTGGPIVPFIEGHAGGSYMKFRLDGQTDGFTYPLEFAVGAQVLTSERTALTASLGYYHLSNAGRHYPNLGINGIMVNVGFTAFPDF
jgi:hypothetical protein